MSSETYSEDLRPKFEQLWSSFIDDLNSKWRVVFEKEFFSRFERPTREAVPPYIVTSPTIDEVLDDIINLNVSGELISVKRSTLCLIKDSRLYKMFNGESDHKLARDKHGNVYLDYNPYCFKKILDYLKSKSIETIDQENNLATLAPYPKIDENYKYDFAHLVSYLGLCELLNEQYSVDLTKQLYRNEHILPEYFNLKDAAITLKESNRNAISTTQSQKYLIGKYFYSNGIVIFNLHVKRLYNNDWIFIGVLGDSGANLINDSFGLKGSYGWAGHDETYIDGVLNVSKDGYKSQNDLQENDVIQLVLNLFDANLALKNVRTNAEYMIDLDVKKYLKWRLHLNLFYRQDEVQLDETKIIHPST